MFFYDIPNLLAIIIVVSVSFRIGLIPLWLSFFLILFSFTPFFLNDVLFPAAYMPDQFQYFEATQRLRDFNFEPIEIVNVYQEVKWYFPKLKFGHILAVPLGETHNSPCAYFVKDTNKIPDVLSTEDLW